MFDALIVFTAAIFLLIVTPGPGVLSLAGVGAAFGYRDGLWYMAGLFVGTNLVAIAVVTSIAVTVLAIPLLREVLMVASAAYLLYLAFKIAFAGAEIGFIKPTRAPGFLGGVALQTINPKAYAVNTALFSGYPIAPQDPTYEILLKFVIINVIWTAIHFFWLGLGVAVRRMELAPRLQRRINIVMAAAMLAVVGLLALSERLDA